MRVRRQLLWFAGLWLAGVTVTAAVAYAIRFWLSSAL
jgi:hypothetical protein